MQISLHKSTPNKQSRIKVTGSKSESNRLLLLQALYPQLHLKNVSNSDDSQLMTKALASDQVLIDIHHAGTAMRFLTAYLAIQDGRSVVITGSKRMKERPIKILVEALQHLGAEISYKENEGYPPLKINGKKLTEHQVSLKANVSSQYISALLLIASKLENGLELTLEGKITSVPYIKMTLSLLDQIGVKSSFENNKITVAPFTGKLEPRTITVESDWSSASYFFSIVALSAPGTQITLEAYKQDSLQGDADLVNIYKQFGVETTFDGNTMSLVKTKQAVSHFNYDLINAPDIAQTIAVSCFALGMSCDLKGLHTLKIKETDRLVALKTELEKLGATVEITDKSLHLQSSNTIKNGVSIATYNDHRMAMAFAPLALKTDLKIEDAMVVSKSYPTFWDDMETLGIKLSK